MMLSDIFFDKDVICLQEANSRPIDAACKCKFGSEHIVILGCGGTAHRAAPATLVDQKWYSNIVDFYGFTGLFFYNE